MNWPLADLKWRDLIPFIKLAIVIYLLLLIVSWSLANKLIFLPPPAQYSENSSRLVLLNPGPQQIATFYFAPPDPDAPVLLWSHGNAEDIGHLKPLFVELHAIGFGVLAYDYPGYGLSAGAPGERTCYRAINRAFRFLTIDQQIDPARIVLVGQSVGSGPACWLAEREPVGALVLIAPFLSAFRSVTQIPLIPGDKFKNVKRIANISSPLLVIHGSSDEAIPYRQGRKIYQKHPGPKEFLEVPRAGHNDIWHRGGADMIQAIKQLAGLTNRQP